MAESLSLRDVVFLEQVGGAGRLMVDDMKALFGCGVSGAPESPVVVERAPSSCAWERPQ